MDSIGLPLIVVSYFTIMGFIRYFTKDADDDFNSKMVGLLSDHLQKISKNKTLNITVDFNRITDKIFGESLFSFKEFYISTLISSTVSIVIFMLLNIKEGFLPGHFSMV